MNPSSFGQPAFNADAAYDPNDIFASDHPIYTLPDAVILSGQNVVRGTVMGQITASGKWIKSLSAAVDGSEVPAGILAADIDASAGDKSNAMIYLAGGFKAGRLTIGTAHTFASIKVALAKAGIFLYDEQVY